MAMIFSLKPKSGETSVFCFGDAGVRVTVGNSGEPMFCLADVCKVLDIGNSRMVKERLNRDGVSSIDTIDSMGRTQQATFISEQNLYKVIFHSRKPEAEAFADWVTGDVLPAIRKTGGYIHSTENDTPEMIMARALQVADETIRRHRAMLENANRQLEEQAPKVAFVDAFCASRGNILIRDFAKHVSQALNIRFGQNEMFDWLKSNGYMNENRYPSQRATDCKFLHVTEGFHVLNSGNMEAHHTTRITPKGQEHFFKLISKTIKKEDKSA